jgi:hypothetical protein
MHCEFVDLRFGMYVADESSVSGLLPFQDDYNVNLQYSSACVSTPEGSCFLQPYDVIDLTAESS